MRHLDLFAGIGGFSLAASRMGWKTVAQVEWDKYCQKVLAKNFPDVLRFGDIVEFNKMLQDGKIIADSNGSRNSQSELQQTNLSSGSIRDNKQIITDTGLQRQAFSEKQTARIVKYSEKREITSYSECTAEQIKNERTMGCTDEKKNRQGTKGIFDTATYTSIGNKRINLGRIDIITGGFPCQPFSHAGKRKGTDDSRYLWPEMLTTIRILKPSFVVGENVAGLVSMENGKTLDNILSDLANEGYQTEQFIIPACSVGAWHRRDRIWIVAYCQCKRLEKWEKRKLLEQCKTIKRSDIQSIPISNNTKTTRQREYSRKILQGTEPAGFNITNNKEWWTVEPSVGRVANGISNRVDRLKGLGNSVVPQVVYEIFKAIEQIN